jgi:hypothetical protein
MPGPATQSPAPPPADVARIGMIDGLRGLFLILMTTTHLTLAGGFFFKHLHPDTVSFIDAAYGFVFLSGLVVGLVYTKAMLRQGLAAGAARLRRRALEVYLHAVAVVAGLALAAVAIPGFAQACADWLGPLASPDWRALAAGVALLQEADYADILQPYVFYMLAAPFALRACLAGRWRTVLGVSVALWVVSQFGAAVPFTSALREGMHAVRPDLRLPSEFNILAWQLVFFPGLILGAQSARGRLELDRWFCATKPGLFIASIAVAGACAVLTIVIHHAPAELAAAIDTGLLALTSKPRVGLICLANFAAAAYGLTWLALAGPKAAFRWIQTLSNITQQVLSWSFLRLLGRHSLQVYVWHVALVYAVLLLDTTAGPFNALVRHALVIGVFALLAAPALLREQLRGPRRRLASQAAAPQPALH